MPKVTDIIDIKDIISIYLAVHSSYRIARNFSPNSSIN